MREDIWRESEVPSNCALIRPLAWIDRISMMRNPARGSIATWPASCSLPFARNMSHQGYRVLTHTHMWIVLKVRGCSKNVPVRTTMARGADHGTLQGSP